MEAPDWYRNERGSGKLLPPPPVPPPAGVSVSLKPAVKPPNVKPPSTMPLSAKVGSGLYGARTSLGLPPVPEAPTGVAAPLAPPPLPALRTLAPPQALEPTLVPALPADGIRGSTPVGGRSVALSLMDGTSQGPKSGAAFVKSAPKKKDDDKPFLIPGLQSRPYSDEEINLAFDMIDLDRHEYLEEGDIRRVLDLSGHGDATSTEIDEMIRMCDHDGSRQVSPGEFAALFTDPPALFRNFDLHRREGVSKDVSDARSESAYSKSLAPTKEPVYSNEARIEAVEIIANACSGGRLKPDFIKEVYQRFVAMDTDETGFVTYDDFCMILLQPQTDAMRRAFNAFDTEDIGEVDLRNFIVALAMHTDSRPVDKFRFAFMLFDEEQRGNISKADMAHLFQAIAPHLSPESREKHINRIYSTYRLHPNAKVPSDEFLEYAEEHVQSLVPHLADGTNETADHTSGRTVSQDLGHGTRTPSRTGSIHRTPSRTGSILQGARSGSKQFGAKSGDRSVSVTFEN